MGLDSSSFPVRKKVGIVGYIENPLFRFLDILPDVEIGIGFRIPGVTVSEGKIRLMLSRPASAKWIRRRHRLRP